MAFEISNARKGMQVFGPDGQPLGTVEEISGNEIIIGGKRYGSNSFSRHDQRGLHMHQTTGSGGQQGQGGFNQTHVQTGETKIPVAEEKLNVEKRQGQVGEVQLHKTVVEEQKNIPVELHREQVDVQTHDTTDRPLRPGEQTAAFQEGTIRVPLMGEKAVVSKETVVTGEVALNKTETTQHQQISDTVRKERVEVDKGLQGQQNRPVITNEQVGRDRSSAPLSTHTHPHQNAGAGSNFSGSQLAAGAEVVDSNNEYLGTVKEVSGQTFLLDRSMARDVYVPFSAVQNASGQKIVLNIPSVEIDNQGWENPPIL